MDQLFSVIVFAITASITPGPNTLLAMASGIKFGTLKSLPLLFGISIGFALMLLAVGIGLGEVFRLYPQLTILLKVAGIIYLIYLAWKIASSSDLEAENKHRDPLSFLMGLLIQWTNVKAWMVCISATSAFTVAGKFYIEQVLLIATTFLVTGPICVGIWVCGGAFLKRQLRHSKLSGRVNQVMAILLLMSIVPVIGNINID